MKNKVRTLEMWHRIYIYVRFKIMPYALVIRDLRNFSNLLIVTFIKFVTNLKVSLDLKFPMVATRFVHSRISSGKLTISIHIKCHYV